MPDIPLTARQKEVIALAAQGLDNHEIAEELGLASGTVRNMLSDAYRQLDLPYNRQSSVQRVRLVLWWLRKYPQTRQNRL